MPLIDDTGAETEGAVAAESEAVRLRALLAPLRVGLVHGRLKAAARDAEMTRFRDGELDVLVGTTVVEVGVDVPEATMMVIEGADRFGLAQLHQLRGRVGRGTVESFCVLVSDSTDEVAQARLKAVAELRDGFELAERDFELRREGNVLGLAQSGLPQSARRVPPGQGPPGARDPRPRARRGVAGRTRRAHHRRGRAAARTGRRAGSGAWPPATPTARTRTDDRCLTPAASSRAGRAASASPVPAGRRGRSATASSRPCSPSWSRTSRTPVSSTCSPAVARPASSRCPVAPTTSRSWTATPRRSGSSRRTSRRPTWPARACGPSGTDVLRWLGDPARAAEPPYDVVVVDPPYDKAELMAAALAAVEPIVRPGGRVVAKHARQTPPPAAVGLLASERERRFGETTLTFYRRAEER